MDPSSRLGTSFAAYVDMQRTLRTIALSLLVIVPVACGRSLYGDVRSSLTETLTSKPEDVPSGVWDDVLAFYAERDDEPAWIGRRQPARDAERAIEAIGSAREHGLDPADYGWPELDERRRSLAEADGDDVPEHVSALTDLEWRLTASLVALGHDVAYGRTRVPGAPAESARDPLPLGTRLSQAVDDGIDGWLEAVQPGHPEYDALRHALMGLRATEAEGGWPVVPGDTLEAGDSGEGVLALRARLVASGDLRAGDVSDDANPAVYDDVLAAAVMSYQSRSGLASDGVAGGGTLASLNVPIADRIAQVGRNLDRWRRLPDDLGSTHVFVNVAAADLDVRHDGDVALHMNVIVGDDDTRTPIFSDEMESVVFSPYWNIPESIAVGETAVEAATDQTYLARNRIEVLRRTDAGVEPVDPDDVDWEDPEAVAALLLRQQPGAGNALGHVKFLFPNAHNVYLHDTPNRNPFEGSRRALSHGCVRVADPTALARFVLRHDPSWTPERIAAAMASGTEEHVALDSPMPVHLTYFTARVDEAGRVGFVPDVYDFDPSL